MQRFDHFGREINIGDKVLYIAWWGKIIKIAKVIDFSPKCVKINYLPFGDCIVEQTSLIVVNELPTKLEGDME